MNIELISKPEKNDNVFKTKNIFIGMAAVAIVLVLKLFGIYIGVIETTDYLFNSINVLLGFMAVVSCLLFYDENRKDEIFIMSLVYISLLIDIAMGNVDNFTYKTFVVNYKVSVILLNSLTRILLIKLIVIPNNKISNFIKENKYVAVLLITFISVVFNILESNLGFFKKLKTTNICLIYYLLLFICSIILIIFFINKALKEESFSYSVLVFSVVALNIKYLYTIVNILNPTLDLRAENSLVTAIVFIVVIFGAFLQFKVRIDKSKKLENNINIFYRIIDTNKYSRILICDTDWNIIYCNGSVKEAYKDIDNINVIYKMIEYNIRNKLQQVDRKVLLNIKEQLFENKKWSGVLKIHNNNNIDITIYRCNVQTINVDGDINYIVSYDDITSEYLFKSELFEAGEKFDLLSNNIKDTIVILNKQGEVEYINQSGIELLEYSSKEIIGKNVDSCIMESVICKKYNGREDLIMENKILSKSGKVIKVETIKSPIIDFEGNISGWILVARDMEYTDALKNIKVKYEEIKDYQKIKNEFFANLSHELRTPTNIIYSSMQLLNSKMNKEDIDSFITCYNKYNGVIKQNCFRILRLTNNMIDMSKVEAGYVQLEVKNYEIISFIEQITMSFIPYVESKKIEIVFDTEIEELEVQFDEEKLERVIFNLLSNAIKYTEEYGHILVKISLEDNWVKITVKDDGIGIPSEMREVIFNRFVQVNKSLNRLKEGSGIGLALVKSIVELHNGKVFIADNDDKGSEFVVLLPNCKNEEEGTVDVINSSKPMEEKISIELSDIYDI